MSVSLIIRTFLRTKLSNVLYPYLCAGELRSLGFPMMVTPKRKFSNEPEDGQINTGKSVHHAFLKPPEGVPCSIFRRFNSPNDQLGPGADPNGDYKNPEYFGYHKGSFADFLVHILEIRESRKDKSGVKCLYECETPSKVTTKETQENLDDKICMQITILPEGEGKALGDPAQADECGLIERENVADCTKRKFTAVASEKALKEKKKITKGKKAKKGKKKGKK